MRYIFLIIGIFLFTQMSAQIIPYMESPVEKSGIEDGQMFKWDEATEKLKAFDFFQGDTLGTDLIINSTVLTDLTNLEFDIKAGEVWYFRVTLQGQILNASADLLGQWNCATCQGIASFSNLENAAAKNLPPNTISSFIPVASSSGVNGDPIIFEGAAVGVTDETVTFQVGNNSGTNPQTFSRFSSIIAFKLN